MDINHKIWASQLQSSSREKKHKAPNTKCSKIVGKSSNVSMDYCIQNYNPRSPNCKLVVQLELKQKVKQPKLLSSKSLSQLVSRGLFFRKNPSVNNVDNDKQVKTNDPKKLTTAKSFPSAAFHSTAMDLMLNNKPEFVHRVDQSASLIGLPTQSNNNSFCDQDNNCTLEQPNLSPIVGSQNDRDNHEAFSWSSTIVDDDESPSKRNKDQASQDKRSKDSCEGKTKKTSSKYKSFKNTTLVLRDVKNSIGLRMRAKHESQAFKKLTNDLATPPTKLYSPFNIYTESSTKESKSKRNLNLNKNKPNDIDNCSIIDEGETPKRRVALQYKKHLMQANKFTFDSPAGKFRETVKDVEHFQQCIEDISKAIRTRN